jgi:hypothetical protein
LVFAHTEQISTKYTKSIAIDLKISDENGEKEAPTKTKVSFLEVKLSVI